MERKSNGKQINESAQTLRTWSGGVTREIFVSPPESSFPAANYAVWVGSATIERSVSYSFFPGYSRIHVPIEGHGVRLHFRDAEEMVTLHTFDHYRFDGGRPLHAELIDGPVAAFNLILRDTVQARVRVLRWAEDAMQTIPAVENRSMQGNAGIRILYVVRGVVSIPHTADQAIHLNRGDSYVVQIDEVDRCDIAMLRALGSLTELVVADIVC